MTGQALVLPGREGDILGSLAVPVHAATVLWGVRCVQSSVQGPRPPSSNSTFRLCDPD